MTAGLWITRGALWTATIGSGLLAGLYLAFSIAVLPALVRRPPDEAVAVLQETNRAIVNPVFLLLFLGSTLACLLVAGSPLVVGGEGGGWRVAGGLVGLAGFVSTIAVNVPLNDRIDREGTLVWARFVAEWVPANHLRALTSLVAAVLLTIALRRF